MRRVVAIATLLVLWTPSWAFGLSAEDLLRRGKEEPLAYKKIEYFTEALRLNPRYKEAFEARGLEYFFQRRFELAARDMDRVIELAPGSVDAYMIRGTSLMKAGHPSGFRAELFRVWPSVGRFFIEDKSHLVPLAAEDFSRAIELSPDLGMAYARRAEAYRLMGMADKALKDCGRALALGKDPKTLSAAYGTRAEIYRKLGDDELYEKDFRKSIGLSPFISGYPPLHVPLTERYLEEQPRLDTVWGAGLGGLIVLAFALIFRAKLPRPRKDGEPPQA